MSDFRKSFEEDLEKLIQLFKRIKDKSASQLFTDFDKTLVQNLDFMIKNYETFKNNIPVDFINQMGEPFQQMLKQMIEQLEEELGDDFLYTASQEPKQQIENEPVKNIPVASNEAASNDEMIRQIDEMLKNPGLSESDINKLLDRRLKLNQSQH